METFSALMVICEGNPPPTGGLPPTRVLTRSFDVSFDLRQNKRLSKQETPVISDAIVFVMPNCEWSPYYFAHDAKAGLSLFVQNRTVV